MAPLATPRGVVRLSNANIQRWLIYSYGRCSCGQKQGIACIVMADIAIAYMVMADIAMADVVVA